jgi:hypothetical protein
MTRLGVTSRGSNLAGTAADEGEAASENGGAGGDETAALALATGTVADDGGEAAVERRNAGGDVAAKADKKPAKKAKKAD